MKLVSATILLIAAVSPVNGWFLKGFINLSGRASWDVGVGRRQLCVGDEVCARTCQPKGAGDDIDCHFSCLRTCKGQNEDESTKGGRMVPMPVDFGFYDCEGKGRFNVKCLASQFREDINDPTMNEMFRLADKNKDKFITPVELSQANWIFEGMEDNKAVANTGDAADETDQGKPSVAPPSNPIDSTENKNDGTIQTRGQQTEEEHLANLVDKLRELLKE